MNNEILINNIIKLTQERNIYPTNACIDAGVGKSFISTLRRGVAPSVDKVQKLADYFGVTTSELLGEKKPPTSEDNGRSAPAVADEETRLMLEMLCRLNQKNLNKARDHLEYLLARQEEDKDK